MFGGDEINAIVVDVGSNTVKAGFAGEDQPKSVFPSMVGQKAAEGDVDMEAPVPRKSGGAIRKGNRDLYAGNMSVNYPRNGMEVASVFDPLTGLYSDMEGIEAIYDHVFYQSIDVDPKDRPLLLCEPSCNTDEMREKMVQLMFEKYEAPAIFMGKDAVLSTFASARSTAMVVDVGHNQTTLSAVLDGFLLRGSVLRSPLAGKLLTEVVGKAVAHKGATIKTRFEFRRIHDNAGGFTLQELDTSGLHESFLEFQRMAVLQDIKEMLCGRVNDVPVRAEDLAAMPSVGYELPDGEEVELHGERVAVPEVLFNPDIVSSIPNASVPKTWGGEACVSLPQSVKAAINKVDVDHCKEMYSNIVLVGGSSVMVGLRDRLEMAVSELAPITAQGGMRVRVAVPTAGAERKFATWIGGSILASLGTFQQMWMSRQEYQEHGAALIHKRAP